MDISIIIPAHDEAANIGALLASLLAADLGGHTLAQVLVYDDVSTDGTADIVDGFAARHPIVELIRGKARVGCTGAIAQLIEAATSDVIVRVNADVRVCEGGVKHLVDAIAAGASLAIAAHEPLVRRVSVPVLASSFAFTVVERLKAGAHKRHYAVGHFGAIARRMVADLALPPDVINEDHFIAMHVFRKGGDIVYVPSARCQVNPAATFADYWRMSRRVLEGERQLQRRYGVEKTPFLVLVSAVIKSAARRPVSAACWALYYTVASSLPSPVRNSAWEPVRSTKTRIA